MSKLPFIIPEHEFNFRSSMVLIILMNLSTTKTGKLHLTIDRINIYRFLLNHPKYLRELLQKEKGKELVLHDNELNNIQDLFPNYSFHTRHKELKSLLIMLSNLKFVSVTIEKDIYFSITTEGTNIIKEVESEFIKRSSDFCIAMKSIQSLSTNQLYLKVQSIIKGGMNT
ncbi:ABC-three component system middle component 4 [Peribacillus sp. NPDC101481]|uniref:ABC-three component system middle component 4 n=1 Tax=Peribacillus sp. NPDC101481 TaxID=3364403 RepID=UPI00381842C2